MCSDASIRAASLLPQARHDSFECCDLERFEPHRSSQCRVLLQQRYRILKLLGQGSFGRTFLARDEQNAATFYVIKQLFSPSYRDDRLSASTLQQAQPLAELGEHPQIPRLLATFEEDGFAFMVQEWVAGWTLQHELTEAAPFDEADVWQVLRSLLPVLQYLHEHQVIHRDLKPANIIRRFPPSKAKAGFLPQFNDLVLVDFSAAKYLSAASIVYTDTLIGSAEYASPEQLRGQAVFASDLYSLGVTCLHLLTQMSPFDLYDSSENVWQWQASLPVPISPRLETILCKLLQPALKQRYQTAADVLLDVNGSNVNGSSVNGSSVNGSDVNGSNATTIALRSLQRSPSSPAAVPDKTLPFVTAAMQAALTMRSIASITAFEPLTQTWHHLVPNTDLPNTDSDPLPRSSARRGRKLFTTTTVAITPSVQGAIELIFSALLLVILTSIGSMTLICFCFEMERHSSVLPAERQPASTMLIQDATKKDP